MSTATSAVAFFRETLRRGADPARARGEKAYLKSDLRFYGSGQPAIRAAVREYRRAHPELSRAELRAIADALWDSDVHELRSAAIGVLESARERLTDRDLGWLVKLIRKSNTWAHVDWLAPKVIGDVLARYPQARTRIERWARDESFWVRRAALLAEHDALRGGGGDFARWSRIAAGMLDEREFFIRKAIGWVLREVSKKRPALTHAFLREHRKRISRLSLQEGAKYLAAAQRKELGLAPQAARLAREKRRATRGSARSSPSAAR